MNPASIASGEKLSWDPEGEKITNSQRAEAIMKESYYRPEWDLNEFIF
ncbi:MAG: hypothetical protein AAGJ81_00380 [Verrucomicrobiota bacterium]